MAVVVVVDDAEVEMAQELLTLLLDEQLSLVTLPQTMSAMLEKSHHRHSQDVEGSCSWVR